MSTSVLRMQHSSLQFSDPEAQQEHDVQALFEKGQSWPIKGGTEAGAEPGNSNDDFLRKFAKEYDHVLHFANSNWIAVDRRIIKKGSVKKGSVFVVDNDKTWGRGHDSVMATLGFTHSDPRIGRINIGEVHYPLKGSRPGDVNHEWNQLYADRIGAWMRTAGRGNALAFVMGDFNMQDRLLDLALGNNFKTMADELNRYYNTGHGSIDAIGSYDRDGRVAPKSFKSLNDNQFRLYSDHYVCRGVWNIKHLKTK